MVVITSGLADSRPVAFEILLALADGERHDYSSLQEVERYVL